MISILAQERLVGATLGSALTGFIVLEQRKRIHESLALPKSQSMDQSQVRDGMLGKQYRMEFASLWNKAVDQTFEPAIEYLSSRKW
ncbi:hypothetical protein BRARA_D01701 [Brassica rapa]|uniref:BnaA04g28390D protein n=3 Tax=Brassica TaxID=3705 RepID=A0A078JAI4_BRANA|nr:uncharacterized protein BNAA04G28390D isoform X2 [Brassica napus]RID66569.1 hypothetical protein BRARA_D01701 [Brassica rapa]CDY62457.1 BnaA04g28390D [Brassica napus]